MSVAARTDPHRPPDSVAMRTVRLAGAVATGLVCTVVVAYLAASGHPEIALGLLLAVPVAAFVLRYPLSVIAIWLVVAPFLVATDGGAIRIVYWLVHRMLPVVALANIMIGAKLGNRGPLPRLHWPELAMFGYLVLSQVSILFTSSEVLATTYHLYDRVFIPMCLYLIVRFVQPDGRDLRRLLPIVVYLLLSQAAFGVLQWVAPEVLPDAWLGRLGTRTTGSLSHPNVYGTTMLFAGVVALHAKMTRSIWDRRWTMLVLFPASLVFVFLTYSRASWLAGLVVVLGLFTVYPRYITKIMLVTTVVALALVASGRIDQQIEMAQQRFRSDSSEESALSRLPVMAASVRMFRDRPLNGWGYGNFDYFDRQFQGAVGSLVVPDKDHASHNLYLTILAEQGFPGFLLYVCPAFWWLGSSRKTWRAMPIIGPVNRNLLVSLWLVLAAHVAVNNYANMRVVFGLGLWWLVLGMIATLITRYRPTVAATAASRRSAAIAGTASRADAR
jgi:O-antigen ligase